MPSFLSDWSPMTCDHTAPRSGILGSNGAVSTGDGRTIELRIRISRLGGGSARCSRSRAPVQEPRFSPKFLSPHAAVYNTFNVLHHLTSAKKHRALRCGDDHVAGRGRSSPTIPEPAMLRARR